MLKSFLKESPLIRSMYRSLIRGLSQKHPKIASKILFYISQGKRMNMKNPQSFNEKIMWLKLNTYYKNPLITTCADKAKMQEYIRSIGCSEILPEIFGVWSKPKDIDWDSLPNKFVIKCNHGCGYNIVCFNKAKMNEHKVKEQLAQWLNEDYYKDYAETNYQFIPKRIVCERFIETSVTGDRLPIDYKIYCFNGKPKAILVCEERSTDDSMDLLKLTWFDTDWKPLDIGMNKNFAGVLRPKNLDKMIKYCVKISKPFPFVRIDFYDTDEQPYLGEMTFTPAAGIAQYYNEYGLEYLGRLLNLPI